ncbi:MAG: D-alanyl-D-alanine carboxypeptidase family protein [Dehalococcoidia bacterium]
MTAARSRRTARVLALGIVAAIALGASMGAHRVERAEVAPGVLISAVSASASPPALTARAAIEAPRSPAGPLPAAWRAAPMTRADAPPPPATAAAAVAVLDEASASVLYAWNGDAPLAPASLTKIATAIVAIEHGDLDRRVTVDVDSRVMRGSTVMGLIPGDEFSVRDLLYGMMLPSGNDAALAVGRAVSGSDAAFVTDMNALAERLGLRDTHFANPHGLNAPGHATSARDLALLSRYAMSLPEFGAIVSTTSYAAHGSRRIELLNVINDVLYSIPGADGVKSGFTRQAGRTLVASATRDGHRVYVVVLNDQQRLTDATALLNWAFEAHEWEPPRSVGRPQDGG